MGLATGDPERHRPARLDCDQGRPATGWRRCRRSPRCAWPGRGRRRGAGGRWYRREAVATQMAYRAWRVEVDRIYGLASDDVCGCRLPAREGSDPRRCRRPSHLANDPDCEHDPMKVSDPLTRGLRTALRLTITLLSTGALVTVLNGLLPTPGGVQRRLGRPAALRDHRPELARRPGKEVVPESTGRPQDAPTDGPLDPGTEG